MDSELMISSAQNGIDIKTITDTRWQSNHVGNNKNDPVV